MIVLLKKFVATMMAVSLLFATFLPITNASTMIVPVYLDGEKLSFDVNPIIKHGTTLVPMRTIFEKQNAKIYWNNNTKTVTAIKGSTTIVYTIGSNKATVNNRTIILNNSGEITREEH